MGLESRFALSELLVAITAHPYFNQGLPADCGDLATEYHLPPLFDPWVVDVESLEERNNSVGDTLHRHPVRVLLSSIVSAMQWADYTEFFIGDPTSEEGQKLEGEAEFQRDIGVAPSTSYRQLCDALKPLFDGLTCRDDGLTL